MPAIRTLCKEFKEPTATPHVFVGVSSILKLLQEQTSSTAILARKRAKKTLGDVTISKITSFDEKQLPALIAVIALYTVSLIAKNAPTAQQYVKKKQLAIDTLLAAAPKDGQTSKDDMSEDIEIFLREARNGWVDMEWYTNLRAQLLPEECEQEEEDVQSAANEAELDDEAVDTLEQEDGEEEPVRRRVLRKSANAANGAGDVGVSQRGIGGMMTPETDYLSPEKREEYQGWKAGVLAMMGNSQRN